ncbi:MAG: MipA/OmpV family protein [Novosphingobium sp.]
MQARDRSPDQAIVAVGAIAGPDYEGSDDYAIAPVGAALIRYKGYTLNFRANAVSFDVIPDHVGQNFKIDLGPYIDLNFDRAITPHDTLVSLTRKRKTALEGGGFIGITRTGVLTSAYDQLTLRITAVYDLGNVHHSFIISPTAEYLMPVSKAAVLGATLTADVVGGRYARYYFGVGPTSSALSGLPFYTPGAGVKSASLSLYGAISLRGDLQKRGLILGALVNYERLLGSFAGSPIVSARGSPNQIASTMAVAYHF